MFTYAVSQYLQGGSFFFVLLQVLIATSTVLMLANTNDTFDTILLSAAGVGLSGYALHLFHGTDTIIFVVGLCMVGVGFAMQMASVARQVVLALGSVCIALFSYMEGDAIFLLLNVFFALFSGWHACRMMRNREMGE